MLVVNEKSPGLVLCALGLLISDPVGPHMDTPTRSPSANDAIAPEFSTSLRDKLQAFDQEILVQRLFDLLARTMEDYAHLPLAMQEDVLAHLKFETQIWFDVLLKGTSPSPEQIHQLEETGRRRAHQGLPLTTMLRSYRLGAREVWLRLLEFVEGDPSLRDEMLFKLSPYLLTYFDIVPQTIAAAYLEEQYHQARWRDALRYQLCSIMFSFPDDESGFWRAAQALGLDAAAPRIGLAFEVDLPQTAPAHFESELDRLTAEVARHSNSSAGDIVRILHRERLVMWVACAHGESIAAGDRRVAESLRALLDSTPGLTAVGVGLMNQGARGWAVSVEEAFVALDTGRRAATSPRVRPYSKIAVDESVRHSDSVLRYLVSLVEHLAREPDLLNTLQTFFDKQRHRKATAAALDIHPNTLNYRLARIESQLGANLDDVAWLAKLDVALKLHRASAHDG